MIIVITLLALQISVDKSLCRVTNPTIEELTTSMKKSLLNSLAVHGEFVMNLVGFIAGAFPFGPYVVRPYAH